MMKDLDELVCLNTNGYSVKDVLSWSLVVSSMGELNGGSCIVELLPGEDWAKNYYLETALLQLEGYLSRNLFEGCEPVRFVVEVSGEESGDFVRQVYGNSRARNYKGVIAYPDFEALFGESD